MKQTVFPTVLSALVAAGVMSPVAPPLQASQLEQPLRFSASTDRAIYGLGETVEITVASLNLSDEEITYSGIQPSWTGTIVDANDLPVLSFQPPHVPNIYSRQWKPNAYQSLGFFRWDQRSDPAEPGSVGEQVPPGVYRLRVVVNVDPTWTVESSPFVVCESTTCVERTHRLIRYVPASANGPGLGDTQWHTDLLFTRTADSGEPAMVTIALLESRRANPSPREAIVELDWRTPRRVDNVLEELFEFQGIAALRITADLPDVVVTSETRSTNATGGSVGDTVPAVDPLDALTRLEPAVIHGLEHAPPASGLGKRTNIGFVNPGSTPVTVELLLVEVDGDEFEIVGGEEPILVVLDGFEHRQLSDVFANRTARTIVSAFAALRVRDGDGVIAYASVVDRITGDASFHLAETASQVFTPAEWE